MTPLAVVGGVYRERVISPEHIALFGSAGRAAASIGPDRAALTLHTAIEVADRPDLEHFAKANAIALNAVDAKQTVSFSYVHGLDTPRIVPPPHLLLPVQINVKAERILCFGALDIEWQVDGGQVVYDPQDAFGATPFRSGKNSANKLAVVLNEYEAQQITRASDVHDQLTSLFAIDHPEVVVLKCGPKGTIVATKDGKRETLPPLLTPTVFKLGSGDVFSAMFAWAWMIQNLPPRQCAEIASEATANYVATRTLPLPDQFLGDNREYGIRAAKLPPLDSRTVYLAAPFFTMPQRWLVEEARLYLGEGGVTVFSPLHDVGYGPADVVAARDLEALRSCDAVFAIASGLDPGTIFEIGYARSLNKPVVVYVENEKHDDLKMLIGSDCLVESDFTTSIYKAVWTARFPQ
jgi:nucleoside 2-deoxyribosyltransferase